MLDEDDEADDDADDETAALANVLAPELRALDVEDEDEALVDDEALLSESLFLFIKPISLLKPLGFVS